MDELDTIWKVDRTEAQRILDAYLSRGFNHITAGPAFMATGYQGPIWGVGRQPQYDPTNWVGDPDGYADFLEWLQSHGLAVTLFLLPDCAPYFDGHGWDWSLVERDLTPLYSHPRLQAIIRRTVLAFEVIVSIAEFAKAFDWQRRVFPNALRLYHNEPGHLGPGLSTEDEQACWRSAALHGCQGLALQAHPPHAWSGRNQDGRTVEDQMMYDLDDMQRRFEGRHDSPWGPEPICCDGVPLVCEYMEGTAASIHNHRWPEVIGRAWGELALRVPHITNALDGAPTEVTR